MPINARWIFAGALAVVACVALFAWFPRSSKSSPPPSVAPMPPAPPLAAPVPETASASIAEPPAAPEPERLARYSDIVFQLPGRQGSIRGRVFDRSGKPIQHAVIHTKSMIETWGTDASGNFSVMMLKPGTYELVATHSDYSDSSQITAETGSRTANLVLQPLGTIEGRVMGALDSQPVSDFRIRPERRENSFDLGEVKYKRVNDSDGRFTLERVKAGTTALGLGAKGFADAVIAIPAIGPGENRKDLWIRLYLGAVLQGRVTNTAGQPVKIARITTGQPPRGVVSDTDGNFTLDSLTPGPVELIVKHESYAPKKVNTVLGSGTINRIQIMLTVGIVVEGEITLGGKPARGNVVLEPAIVEQPKMVNGVPTTVEPAFHMTAVAGPDGKYRIIGVPDAQVRLTAAIEPEGCRTTWSKDIVIDSRIGGGPIDFNFPPASAHVQGTIYAAPQQPLQSVVLLIARYADFTVNGPTSIMVRADTDIGFYSLCLPQGTAGIFVSVYGQSRFDVPRDTSFTLELNDGDTITHDILLYGGATLRVSAKIPSPSPYNKARVLKGEVPISADRYDFLNPELTVAGQSLDESGHVTFRGLEPGTYTVVAYVYSPNNPSIKVLGSTFVTVEKDQDIDVPLAAINE